MRRVFADNAVLGDAVAAKDGAFQSGADTTHGLQDNMTAAHAALLSVNAARQDLMQQLSSMQNQLATQRHKLGELTAAKRIKGVAVATLEESLRKANADVAAAKARIAAHGSEKEE